MAPEHIPDVKRHRLKAICDRRHFGGFDKQEHRCRIDETPDEPRTGDPINFRARPRYPNGAALFVARRKLAGLNQEAVRALPCFETAFEEFGSNPVMTQPAGNPLRQLLPFLANDCHVIAGQAGRPTCDSPEIPANGGREQARVGFVVVVYSHIDQQRSAGKPTSLLSCDTVIAVVDGMAPTSKSGVCGRERWADASRGLRDTPLAMMVKPSPFPVKDCGGNAGSSR